MTQRINPVGLAAVLIMITCCALAYASETLVGKIMAVEKDRIIVMDVGNAETKTYLVSDKTKVTRKGAEAKLSDLAIGDRVTIDADTVKGELVAKSIDAMPSE